MTKTEHVLKVMLALCEQPPTPTDPPTMLFISRAGKEWNSWHCQVLTFEKYCHVFGRDQLPVKGSHARDQHTDNTLQIQNSREEITIFTKKKISPPTMEKSTIKDCQPIQNDILIFWFKSNLCSLESVRLFVGLEYFFFLPSRSSSTGSWKFCFRDNYQTRMSISLGFFKWRK